MYLYIKATKTKQVQIDSSFSLAVAFVQLLDYDLFPPCQPPFCLLILQCIDYQIYSQWQFYLLFLLDASTEGSLAELDCFLTCLSCCAGGSVGIIPEDIIIPPIEDYSITYSTIE